MFAYAAARLAVKLKGASVACRGALEICQGINIEKKQARVNQSSHVSQGGHDVSR